MKKGPIIVLANKKCQKIYRFLSIGGEEIEIHSWSEVLNAIRSCGPDIVIIDSNRDINTGLGLLKEIKSLKSDLPVIFVADSSSETLDRDALRAGARDYFRKPMNILDLQESIVHLLELKRTSKEKRTAYVPERHLEVRDPVDPVTNDKPTNLLRAIRYIEENLSEMVCLEDVAKEASLSKYHFCRNFKRFFGRSPMKFVTFMRIRRAKELLQRDDLSITEVALEVGFNDHSSFVRGFRKFTNVSPREYRRSIPSQ